MHFCANNHEKRPLRDLRTHDFFVSAEGNSGRSKQIHGLTNRFHFAVRLFSYRSQMTLKCGKNTKVAHGLLGEWVADVLVLRNLFVYNNRKF